jgi:hypothetical protein
LKPIPQSSHIIRYGAFVLCYAYYVICFAYCGKSWFSFCNFAEESLDSSVKNIETQAEKSYHTRIKRELENMGKILILNRFSKVPMLLYGGFVLCNTYYVIRYAYCAECWSIFLIGRRIFRFNIETLPVSTKKIKM